MSEEWGENVCVFHFQLSSLWREFVAERSTVSNRTERTFDRALQDVPNDMYIYWINWILSHFYSLEKRTTCATGDHLESQSWFLLAVRISRTVTVAQCPPWFDYHYLLGRFWRKTFCSSLSSHGNCQQNPRAGHYQDHDVASATQFVRLFRRDLSWWDQFKLAYLTLSKKFILFGREISENCVVSGVDYLVQHLRQVTEKIPFLSIFFFSFGSVEENENSPLHGCSLELAEDIYQLSSAVGCHAVAQIFHSLDKC